MLDVSAGCGYRLCQCCCQGGLGVQPLGGLSQGAPNCRRASDIAQAAHTLLLRPVALTNCGLRPLLSSPAPALEAPLTLPTHSLTYPPTHPLACPGHHIWWWLFGLRPGQQHRCSVGLVAGMGRFWDPWYARQAVGG